MCWRRSRSWRTAGCAAPGRWSTRSSAALTGDRSHQAAFRAALRERAELTTDAPERDRRHHVRRADGRVLRDAAGRRCRRARPTRTTCSALLRATGVLCVYGSGFGTRPEDGFFRVVFLASPEELSSIYDDIAEFTAEFLRTA